MATTHTFAGARDVHLERALLAGLLARQEQRVVLEEARLVHGRRARCQEAARQHVVRAQELAHGQRRARRLEPVVLGQVLRFRLLLRLRPRLGRAARAQLVRHAQQQLRRELGRLAQPALAQGAPRRAQLARDPSHLHVGVGSS